MSSVAMMSDLTRENTYSLTEAARQVGIHLTSLRGYIERGMLHPVKVPGVASPRYARQEIEQIIAYRQIRHAPVPPLAERDYYTYPEAHARLGLTATNAGSLYGYVEQGKIRQIASPGIRGAGYLKRDVDALAVERRLAAFRQQQVPTGLLLGRQAAEVVGITPNAFWLQVKKGRLHPVHLPGHPYAYYHREDVEALARHYAQRVVPQPMRELDGAFTVLYDTMRQRLQWFVQRRYRMRPEEAEDVVQSTFLDIWRRGAAFFLKYPTFEQQCRLIYHCVKHDVYAALDASRARQRMEQRVTTEWTRQSVPSPEEEAVRREQIRQWWQQCGIQLSEVRRKVLFWHLMGISYERIVERLHAEGITWSINVVRNYCERDQRLVCHPPTEAE